MTDEAADPSVPSRELPRDAWRIWLRVGVLGVLLAALVLLAKLTGLATHLRTDEIRSRMAGAGVWGPVAYVAVFAAGELIHIPGTVFVAAAVVAYGLPVGGAIGFVGAVVSACVTFAVVRTVGGKPLAAIRWRWVRQALAHLDEHPIRTIVLLRLVLSMAPQLNYALALSNVRARDYVIGSAVGLAPPIAVLSFILNHYTWVLDRLAH